MWQCVPSLNVDAGPDHFIDGFLVLKKWKHGNQHFLYLFISKLPWKHQSSAYQITFGSCQIICHGVMVSGSVERMYCLYVCDISNGQFQDTLWLDMYFPTACHAGGDGKGLTFVSSGLFLVPCAEFADPPPRATRAQSSSGK